jgi:cell division protein FtsB
MVIKYRWRMILGVGLLWSASALVTGFFVVQAYQGARGIEAKRQVKNRILALRSELSDLKEESARMEREIALMRGPVIDGDLLDERVRAELGRVNKNDLVVFVNAGAPAASTR